MQKEIQKKFFCFWDKCIRVGCVKFPLVRREYLSSAVNILTNSLKIFYVFKRNFSNSITLAVINRYAKDAVVKIETVFQPVYHVACQRVPWNGTFLTFI